jgi:hypothetical protein
MTISPAAAVRYFPFQRDARARISLSRRQIQTGAIVAICSCRLATSGTNQIRKPRGRNAYRDCGGKFSVRQIKATRQENSPDRHHLRIFVPQPAFDQ